MKQYLVKMHPALKTRVNKNYHKYSLGRRSYIFKVTAKGARVTYWDTDAFVTAMIVDITADKERATLDNGAVIYAHEVSGAY